ncbi:MAG: hypothetical protein EOP88_21365 [Verrucomicrobiaceae bacterium]|nr:MAG: hypothetical protein EOP88_21365 [Verrucomicrobiaceae bacterium]
MKNALASLLIISLLVSLGMNYSLWQRWKVWAPDKTAWMENQKEWLRRERRETEETTAMVRDCTAMSATSERWLRQAETYLTEQKLEKELRTRRAEVAEEVRKAGLE